MGKSAQSEKPLLSHGKGTRGRKLNIKPYLFLIPSFLIFGLFVFYPFAKTVALSFTWTDFTGKAIEFAGLDIYKRIFTNERFINTLVVSLKFAAMVGAGSFLVGFLLAALANERQRFCQLYEVPFALPMAIASAPAATIWFMIYSPNGIANYLLNTDVRFLLDARVAIFAVALVTIWLNMGVSFIFLLTGMRNVPAELLESASIDGASKLVRLVRIIIPIASPQIFFVIFLNLISSFQSFAQIRLLTQGGPENTTDVLVYSIYRYAISDGRFETAFAQSVVLFVIILCFTLLQFRFEKKGVYY